MANVIDYNGYQIAPDGLSPEMKQALVARNLISPAALTAQAVGNTVGNVFKGVETGGRPANMGYEMRGLPSGITPAPVVNEPIQEAPYSVPEGFGVLAPQQEAAPIEELVSEEPVLDVPAQPVQPEPAYDPAAGVVGGRVRGAQAEAAGAERALDIQNQFSDQTAQGIENLQNIKAQYDSEIVNLQDEKNKLYEEYKAGEIKDPWASKSGGQKAMAVIALALGGAGSALTRTPNYALKIINDDINRDIALQKSNLEKKKGEIDLADNALASARQKFGDDKIAELQLQSLYRQGLNDKLSLVAAQTTSDVAKAKIGEIQGLNTLEMEKIQDESLKRKQELLKGGLEIQALTQKGGEPEKEVLERFVPGVGVALDKEGAAKLREEGAAVFESIPIIDDLLTMNESNFKSMTPTQRAKIGQSVSILTGKLRVPVVGPGAFTDSEREFIKNDIVGNPAAIFAFDDVNKAKLNRLKKILSRSRDAKIKAIGARPFTASEQVYASRLIGAGDDFSSPDRPETGVGQIQQLKQQYMQRLQANPNDAVAKQRLQAIQARGF